MTKEEEIRLSDKELEKVKAYGTEHGLTHDEAATELAKDAIGQRFRKNLGRGPAKVYQIGGKA